MDPDDLRIISDEELLKLADLYKGQTYYRLCVKREQARRAKNRALRKQLMVTATIVAAFAVVFLIASGAMS